MRQTYPPILLILLLLASCGNQENEQKEHNQHSEKQEEKVGDSDTKIENYLIKQNHLRYKTMWFMETLL